MTNLAAQQGLATDQLRALELNALQTACNTMVAQGKLTQTDASQRIREFSGWDQGTMGRQDLEGTRATSAAFLTSRAWASASAVPPVLVSVFPDAARQSRLARAAQALLAHVPVLHVFATTALLLARRRTLDAIWHQLWPATEHLQHVVLFGAQEKGENR